MMERHAVLKYGYTSGDVLEAQSIKFNFDPGELVIVEETYQTSALSSYKILKLDRSDFFFGEASDFNFLDIKWVELR
jgi:hypothetical protein